MSPIRHFSKEKLTEPKVDLAKRPYSDEELEVTDDMQPKIEKLMEFFDEYGIDYNKFDPEAIPRLDFSKKHAYPNTDVYMHVPGQHNIQKWLQAISDIYHKEKSGLTRVNAIRQVTSGWNLVETFDFLNWIKFYESGDHMKYKFAQLWYENPNMGPGYFLHIKKDQQAEPQASAVSPAVRVEDIDFARTSAGAESEKREIIEKQRNKIIGRLDSAEKLLRSQEGHTFAGKEFESLLEAIYQLKKKIQMVNKISSSTRLYEDMIVREANVLARRGFVKAAYMLQSVAQIPAPPSPGDPAGAGNPGVPSGGAATPAQPPGGVTMPQSEPNNPPVPKGISEFLEALDKTKFSPTSEDDLEVEDSLEVNDSDDELLISEAQAAPVEEPITTNPAPSRLNPSPVAGPMATPDDKAAPTKEESLEVTEGDVEDPAEDEAPSTTDFDSRVDQIFANISIGDVIVKLEDLAKIFKTREIPRQLSIVDMMLDSLGLASYFPSLSEATNKALESNNYISTRVDDILSKLRGAMKTNKIDIRGKEIDHPEVADIKAKLKSDEEKEKARKQMRKDQETAELVDETKETPEIEIEEDLSAPAPAPTSPPTPPKASPSPA